MPSILLFALVARFLPVAVLGMFLSGCAWTKTPVNVVIVPAVTQPLSAPAKAPLQLGEVKDLRLVSDSRVVVQKQNAYSKTTGAYIAQKPVAEILRDGIQATLRTNSFQVSESGGTYELKAQIQEFNYDSIGGMWTATVASKFVVRFELFDAATGNSVWRDTLTGRNQDKTAWGDASFVLKTFQATVDDLLRQFIADKTFRKFFE